MKKFWIQIGALILVIFAAMYVSYNEGIVNNFGSYSPYNEATDSGTLSTLNSNTNINTAAQSKLRIIDGLSAPNEPNIKAEINIEIADTPEKSQRGLGFRDSLPLDSGMVFVLRTPRPVFWMKEMRFPLDFIWIKDGVVTDTHRDVPNPPQSMSDNDLPRYSPNQDSSHMLEVNAGFISSKNIQIGDRIEIIE